MAGITPHEHNGLAAPMIEATIIARAIFLFKNSASFALKLNWLARAAMTMLIRKKGKICQKARPTNSKIFHASRIMAVTGRLLALRQALNSSRSW